MKRRGLPSPDWADALACTFAEAVGPRAMPAWLEPEVRADDGAGRYGELG